jgi:hypothetical protein
MVLQPKAGAPKRRWGAGRCRVQGGRSASMIHPFVFKGVMARRGWSFGGPPRPEAGPCGTVPQAGSGGNGGRIGKKSSIGPALTGAAAGLDRQATALSNSRGSESTLPLEGDLARRMASEHERIANEDDGFLLLD